MTCFTCRASRQGSKRNERDVTLAGDLLHLPGKPAGVAAPAKVATVGFFQPPRAANRAGSKAWKKACWKGSILLCMPSLDGKEESSWPRLGPWAIWPSCADWRAFSRPPRRWTRCATSLPSLHERVQRGCVCVAEGIHIKGSSGQCVFERYGFVILKMAKGHRKSWPS